MKSILAVITLAMLMSALAFESEGRREDASNGAERAVNMPAMSMAPASAVDGVYWGGDNIRRADLGGTNPTVLWNFAGAPVAVDLAQSRVYWGNNSTLPGKIMWGNLNGSGTQNTLLTTVVGERIDDLEIDVGAQMIYWTDSTKLHIYRSPIASPSVQMLPLSLATVATLRDIALDLRQPNPKLYWLRGNTVHKCDLNGANPQQLPNALGGIFYGMAIDTCTDQIIAVGITGSPYSSVIIRADLANAGNVTPILQDPQWPPSNIGEDPRKIALDLNGGKMYWTSQLDANSLPTVRRANLNGTGAQIIAQGITSSNWSGGLALELANISCSTVGVNKDIQNNTGQIANNIEILLEGSYTNVNHYDGYPANLFASFTESPAPGGNTLLTWSNPNNDVQPGQIAHVGFNLPGSSVNILGVFWTRDSTTTGCAQQVSTNTHLWGSLGSQVIYANNCLACKSVPRYVGGLVIEWHARHVPLADLNGRTRRKPIRTDIIRSAPIRLEPEAIGRINVPAAPPSALFGVVVHKVGTNPRLAGPDVTTDFLEFPVKRIRTRDRAVSTFGPRAVQRKSN